MAPSRAAAGLPRRWPRRLLIGANIFVAFCLLLTAVAYAYVRWKFGQIDREQISCIILSCEDEDPGDPQNWLLVGTDSRARVSKEDVKYLGTEKDAGGLRTDTMMILRVDPRAEKAAILSIPRDLYVPIAGTNRVDRINTAVFPTTAAQRRTTTTRARAGTLATSTSTTISAEQIPDGIDRLIATIRQNLDLEIDHYVEVDFIGFREIVDAVGGVTMPFPAAARDRLSGLSVRNPGCVELDGDQALGYVRSRHFETFESGRWRTDPTGDIGRIQRQQDFIRRTIRRAISLGVLANPNNIRRLINAGVENVRLDQEVDQDDMIKLAKRFKSLEPDAVDMLTLPADNIRTRQGAAVLRLRQAESAQILDRFLARSEPSTTGPVPNIPPGTVRVRVLNGSGVSGQGGKTALDLKGAGFLTAGIGDADRFGYTKPVVRYGRGQKLKAQLLAAYVVGGAEIKEDLTLQGVDLVLITGSTYGGIRAPGTTPSSTTTTPTTAAKAKPDATGQVALNC